MLTYRGGPKGALSEADLSSFTFHPWAVGALDSTPLRIPDSPGSRFLRKALWSEKHGEAAWKLTVIVAPNGICIWRASFVSDRRHDKRHFDESDAAEAFRICVLDPESGLAREVYLAIIADLGYKGLQHYWHSAIIKPTSLSAPGEAERALQVDSDRAVVECFFGRLKRRFQILGDEGFRLSQLRLDPVVTLCIALANLRQRAKGYALRVPLPNFVRRVPVPMSAADIARCGGIIPSVPPAMHVADRLSGLTPATARVFAREPDRQWPRIHQKGPK